ncbi:hypothetical protein AX774_g4976 [Zancudomyces culisetae]|uniref:Uncharacterized protein n=1 Tax=Zancudomyces culisetae TaxID=1213189 RepID=A0A1R1PKU6_ZANCU|nr:hypothetical protein AX774_g4976 [Zancudomyces culisetae]|eukprot:OMH81585.1 hypothetical protein AX774_g4976 [Zancudomyces culisetae]
MDKNNHRNIACVSLFNLRDWLCSFANIDIFSVYLEAKTGKGKIKLEKNRASRLVIERLNAESQPNL